MQPREPLPVELASAFIIESRHCLSEGMGKIEHCVGQLRDDQVWWRARPEMNSIANLVLHLSGNLRQWIISGCGGAKDLRNRPMEFSDQSNRPKNEVLAILKKVVAESDAVLGALTPEKLLSPGRIQGYETTGMAAIIKAISHFRGHVQEIIHMTRQQLGEKYRFDFEPQGKEQESAGGAAL
jgi:hypothetical protein